MLHSVKYALLCYVFHQCIEHIKNYEISVHKDLLFVSLQNENFENFFFQNKGQHNLSRALKRKMFSRDNIPKELSRLLYTVKCQPHILTYFKIMAENRQRQLTYRKCRKRDAVRVDLILNLDLILKK